MKHIGVCMLCVLASCLNPTRSASTTIPAEAASHQPAPISAFPPAALAMPEPTNDARVIIPGAPGFWCADFRRAPNEADYLNACYRVRQTCENARAHAVENGASVTPCKTLKAAYCFTMADNAKQAIFWRCYSSSQQCSSGHEDLQVKHSTLTFSECAATAWNSGNATPPLSPVPKPPTTPVSAV